jgi:hypothetical protein
MDEIISLRIPDRVFAPFRSENCPKVIPGHLNMTGAYSTWGKNGN